MGKFLDAALNGAATYAGKAYFFKGTKYVRYDWDKDRRDAGYPMSLGEWGFPAPFDKGIDAAIEGREDYDKKAYFFKDDKYIRYDWTGDGKVDPGYPKSILDEWGLPAGFFAGKKKVDAAINGTGEEAQILLLLQWYELGPDRLERRRGSGAAQGHGPERLGCPPRDRQGDRCGAQRVGQEVREQGVLLRGQEVRPLRLERGQV